MDEKEIDEETFRKSVIFGMISLQYSYFVGVVFLVGTIFCITMPNNLRWIMFVAMFLGVFFLYMKLKRIHREMFPEFKKKSKKKKKTFWDDVYFSHRGK